MLVKVYADPRRTLHDVCDGVSWVVILSRRYVIARPGRTATEVTVAAMPRLA